MNPNRVGSIIFELLDLKGEVRDNESAVRFLCDTASERDAEETIVSFAQGSSFCLDFALLIQKLEWPVVY